ncbi:aminotransferase class V-fold PLP-dependent enzyme [Sphingobacterium sp. N143]|uniref:aminotransferase class V-fold PLP-dependent enzyme n=1 Tax=Sphingobacterium sp. N143 TaxID=2746727 RepID=UPI002575F527|nr:aminotransferase class V-fold PLP-dependent enzyme [Sphingobacterium sp. N143]MDM1295632.1 aminotransferase class V-fold PLP-dependent enzyme [Sphingobacterium sp. N143]
MNSPYSEHFDIASDVTYLTTPGSGLLSRETKQWRVNRDQEFFDAGSTLREQQASALDACRNTIGHFFNCPSSNIFLSSCFSVAFNTLLAGLPKHYKVLLLDNDYPSVNFPTILNGFEHQFVTMDEQLETNILDAIATFKPQVLMLSIVQYISGLKIDLSFIQELKHQHPDLLIIGDGTQFLGTDLFDFDRSGFDAVLSSGYKWLMAGFGNGFVLLQDRLKEILYASIQKDYSFLDNQWMNKSVVQLCFEPGHLDTLAQGTLQQSLLQLEQWGYAKTVRYTQQLISQLRSELSNRKLLLNTIANRRPQSNIFNIQINPENFQLLLDEGIKCFPRGTGIRIGLHLYNDHSDLERLLHIIDTKVK